MKCLLCDKEFELDKQLHIHIARFHKTRIEQYYRQFYPRFDLLTKDGIKFKDKEFYFGSLFNGRDNMVKYLKRNPSERLRIILKILSLRKKIKKLIYAPSSVETRTCMIPSPAFVEYLGFDYNACCEKVGLLSRYDYEASISIGDEAEFNILIDTREQKPIDFGCETIPCKLDYGDYTSRSHYKKVFIERKSLADLCGTMSQGYDRVKKEFERCKEMNGNLVVCVEAPISALMSFKSLPRNKAMKASPEFLAHRIREICQEFQCVQFLFLKSREEMPSVIKKLLLMDNDLRTIDLQYQYDCKRLIA